jgi:hypothetical protein
MARRKPRSELSPRYLRRIERGEARGLTLSQSRGHRKAGEKSVSGRRAYKDEQRLLKATRLLEQENYTFSKAARKAGVSTERLRTYAQETGFAVKEGRRWKVPESQRGRVLFPIFSEGDFRRIRLSNPNEKAKLGRYMSRAKFALESNKQEWLSEFRAQYVRDDDGVRHYFETDLKIIRVLDDQYTDDIGELFDSY